MDKGAISGFSGVGLVLLLIGANSNSNAATFIGGILLAIGVIGGLITTAQKKYWGWFAGILLTGFVAAILFGLLGPAE